MSNLPRILLRCCQSMIVALALCLPEVDPGLAKSLQDADLNPQLSQEVLLAEGESVPETSVWITTPEASESIPTLVESEVPEAKVEQPTPSAAAEATETAVAPTQTLSPEDPPRADLLTQPTINSQLLLPARSEKVQLLLAPARESAQLFLPAATEVKWLLPAAPEVSVDRSSPTIQSQLLLPSKTNPTQLSPEFSPTTTLAVTVRETPSSTSTRNSSRGQNRPSTQEQVGRSIARSTVRSIERRTETVAPRPAAEPISSRQPQSRPRLLPASTTPRTPIAASPDRSFFPLLQEKSALSLAPALVSQSVPKTIAQAPQPSPGVQKESPATDNPANPSPITDESNTPTLESPVASGEIGITSAPVNDRISIFSEQNRLFAGLGALLLLLIGLARWIANGFQGETDQVEIDWANLPRSRKNLADPALAEPIDSYVSKFQLSTILSPVGIDHTPIDHTPKDHAPKDHAPKDHAPKDHTPTIAVENLPASKLASPNAASPNAPKQLASSLLVDGKKVNGKNDRPARSIEPTIEPIQKAAQTNWTPTQNAETWIWITLLGLSLVGIAAWLVQFYGLGV